jgi:hypothetical protein
LAAPLSLLSRAATEGISRFPAGDVEELTKLCDEKCAATGDARYCLLRDLFRLVDRWRLEHDEAGGVPRTILDGIDAQITHYLPEILDAQSPAVAAGLARMLSSDVAARLTGPSDWRSL